MSAAGGLHDGHSRDAANPNPKRFFPKGRAARPANHGGGHSFCPCVALRILSAAALTSVSYV